MTIVAWLLGSKYGRWLGIALVALLVYAIWAAKLRGEGAKALSDKLRKLADDSKRRADNVENDVAREPDPAGRLHDDWRRD